MITYYSTHCGTCETFCWLMDARNIRYILVDDETEVTRAMEKFNTNIFPFATIDGVFYNTQQLLDYILEYNK